MNDLLTFLMVKKKRCLYLEKIKFVCKLMHFERDDAENVATEGPGGGGYSLIWVIRVRVAGQGIVFWPRSLS